MTKVPPNSLHWSQVASVDLEGSCRWIGLANGWLCKDFSGGLVGCLGINQMVKSEWINQNHACFFCSDHHLKWELSCIDQENNGIQNRNPIELQIFEKQVSFRSFTNYWQYTSGKLKEFVPKKNSRNPTGKSSIFRGKLAVKFRDIPSLNLTST